MGKNSCYVWNDISAPSLSLSTPLTFAVFQKVFFLWFCGVLEALVPRRQRWAGGGVKKVMVVLMVMIVITMFMKINIVITINNYYKKL
ncbi:hypothetical protein E2C01_068920 [Portunus trituberculatus]|uniref:Uncharacterized protein n=1 Tax=Portunus trituberculatus TaxID=210409 RepID=A0A5B7HZ81_PORTR|nr:hypothetical protein [Portunus trituberculatus]